MVFLSDWVYVSVIITFAALLSTFVFDMTAIAEKRCPICRKSFGDVLGVRRHIKSVERGTLKKAA